MLKLGSLCTGYGGLDMAVEAYYEAETVWVSEFDKYASKVIDARINKPNLGNLKVINWAELEPIDILTAGYPCQPFSHAGLRKGVEDERHLWPYIKTAISTLRPSHVILENVRGHFGLGFREVLGDLASIGYDVRWTLIRASDVGAPHRRERLFILAYPQDRGDGCLPSRVQQENAELGGCTVTNPSSAGQPGPKPSDIQSQRARYSGASNSTEHTNTDSQRCTLVGNQRRTQRHKGQSQSIVSELVEAIYNQAVPPTLDKGKLNVKFVEYMMGLPDGWVTDIDLSRAQMLKILGNGVVPQQAYRALELLNNVK